MPATKTAEARAPARSQSQGKRRVGRPRKQEVTSSDVEPREHILKTAARLFSEKGIAEVSMLEIAQQSGLVQSSLYYWFRRKELIVAELLQQINRLPLAYAKELEQTGEQAGLQLYRLVRFDVRNVCDFPLEITEVHRFSGRDRAAFETYWRERRALTATIERLIRAGIEQHVFRQVDAYLCALTVIAQDESVQNWFRRGPRQRGRAGAAHEDFQVGRFTADEVAEFVATQTLASLLAAPARIEQLRKRALAAPRTRAAPRSPRRVQTPRSPKT
jgi:TetR/AcrR family transcriptional regulator